MKNWEKIEGKFTAAIHISARLRWINLEFQLTKADIEAGQAPEPLGEFQFSNTHILYERFEFVAETQHLDTSHRA